MKKYLLLFALIVIVKANTFAQYPDLPGGGSPYQAQTMMAGAYVIAMDNTNQSSVGGTCNIVINNRKFDYTSGNPVITAVTNTTSILIGMCVTGQGAIPAGTTVTAVTATTVTLSAAPTANGSKDLDFGNITFPVATGADFNLKAYGLIVTLLNNNIKLKWVIKPGKALDANDFSVNATRIKPSLGSAAAFNFAGGPFVIFADDTAGVAALVQTFNGAASTDDVKLYKTNADVSVDVRYDYFINNVVWKPNAAILNDGGNAAIHVKYMTNASVPSGNYSIEVTPDFVDNCFTFASEPHNASSPDNIIQAIRTFVTNGGNYLAQCAAVRTYELSPLARFQSTNGFDNANENGDPATWTYSNTDLSYFQINGYFGIADNGGSLKDWVIPESPGNPPTNNFHYYTSGTVSGRKYTNASVSKLITPASNLGGLVFYLGSHSYDGTEDFEINGQRLYLNAFLTLTNPQGSLTTSGFVVCGNKVTPVTAPVGVSNAPLNAYPINFKLFRETGVEAGLQQSGLNADVQVGATVSIAAPPAVQTGVINAGILPPGSNNDYYLVKSPAPGCLQEIVEEFFCSNLPVSLLNFNAQRNGDNVKLSWETASEDNSKGFNIERKDGSKDWRDVGFVASQAAGGNSSSRLAYQFSDINTESGISQYRLKQLDINGNYEYSTIRSVRGEGQVEKTTVFPNPSNDGSVNVLFGGANVARDIKVYDVSGRIIRQWKKESNNTIQIENLVPGFYSVRILNTETGKQEVHKIIVNKR